MIYIVPVALLIYKITNLPNKKSPSCLRDWFCSPLKDIGDIFQDLDVFKRRVKLHLFFLESDQDPLGEDTPTGNPFEHKSFKLKPFFNPVRPYQLGIIIFMYKI